MSPEARYTRDANGSRLTKTDASGSFTYEWDIAGRLAAITWGDTVIARYQYDPSGRRYQKTVNGETTYYLYGESGLMGEYDASGNLKRGYHYHPEQPWGTAPLWQTQNGAVHYLLYHPSLLPALAFTKTGKVTWEGQFSAFGELRAQVNDGASVNLRFPGQLHDEETQLHYNGFRYYDPSIGRYLRRDPLGLFDGPNAYVYTGNDPVNMFDPWGLATYQCFRRLSMPANSNGNNRWGPEWGINPLTHQYSCIVMPNGYTKCDSTTMTSGPWSPGKPSGGPSSEDKLMPGACEIIENDNLCYETCLLVEWSKPRPRYGLFGRGTNCQEYDNDVNFKCAIECKLEPWMINMDKNK